MNEHLLDIDEVARHLNFSRSFVYKLIKHGELRALRIGAHLRVRPQEINRYLRKVELVEITAAIRESKRRANDQH